MNTKDFNKMYLARGFKFETIYIQVEIIIQH